MINQLIIAALVILYTFGSPVAGGLFPSGLRGPFLSELCGPSLSKAWLELISLDFCLIPASRENITYNQTGYDQR